MVKINPFKAIRPDEKLVDKVASLPYDVVDRKEAKELVKDNPYSYLHIDRSEIELPDADPYDDDVYEKAAENLAEFQDRGWLKKEEEPMFYLYELTYLGESQTGLVVTTSVEEYVEETIKKHEFTTYAKEKDRIRHMDVTDANTSPIFLTYRPVQAVDELVKDWKIDHQPIYDFESFYETTHTVWKVDDAAVIAELETLFADQVEYLYIADGHHRTESAAKVSQLRKDQGRLSEEGKYFLSVVFPVDQLRIFDYNRLVTADVSDDFLEKLTEDFDVQEANERRVKEKHSIGLYLDNKWYHLVPKGVPDDVVGGLDASIVQNDIFNKHFGIEDPRADERLTFVGGIKGLDVLEKAVDNGEATFAVALYPTEKNDLLAVADAGKTMPPKSTWFEPKLLSGLFVHDLESLD